MIVAIAVLCFINGFAIWFYYARTKRMLGKYRNVVDGAFLRIETRLERGAHEFEKNKDETLTWAIMTTFDRKEMTAGTIRTLRVHEPNLPLLVVDNGSRDGTREMLMGMLRDGIIQKLVCNRHAEVPQWQKSFAVSQGMKLLALELPAYFVWLDDDLEVTRPFVNDGIALLEALKPERVKVLNMTDNEVEEHNHPTIKRVTVPLPGRTEEVKIRRTFNGQFDLFSVELLTEFGYPPVAEGINEWGAEDWYYSRRLVNRDYRAAVFVAANHLGLKASKREEIELQIGG